MGFRRRTIDQIDELRREVRGLHDALSAELGQRAALEAQRSALAEPTTTAERSESGRMGHDARPGRRAAAVASTPASFDPPLVSTPPPPAPGTSLADLQRDLNRLLNRLDSLDNRTMATQQQLRLRLDEIVTHMTNQLGELAGELEHGYRGLRAELEAQDERLRRLADAQQPRPGDVAGALEELRVNQVRIANDLARHEIAIRQELASLGDLVGRATRRS